MPSNDAEYAHRYYVKRREDRIRTLGGKCEACGSKQNLIIHRIYTMMNTKGLRDSKQKAFKFRKDDRTIERYMTQKEKLSLRLDLLNNPDNQVLLCPACFKVMELLVGRKQKYGRKEIGKYLGWKKDRLTF